MNLEAGSYSIPPSRAEDLGPEYLEKLPVDIPPLKYAYQGIHEAVREVNAGIINSAWIAIVGQYGSGKTFLLRRIAHEVVERYERMIPMYFYLGQREEILLFNSLGRLQEELKSYVETGIATTKTYGKREAWRQKLKVLGEAYDEIYNAYRARGEEITNVQMFLEVLKTLNRKGYYPLVILDEFERIVYTGEGIQDSSAAMTNFDFISQHFLELTRGHIFNGVGILALTDDLPNLVKRAKEDERPHVRIYEEMKSRKYTEIELTNPNIVFSREYHLNWDATYLDGLCKRLNIPLPQDFINVLSGVLPTPRAIITIARWAQELQINLMYKTHLYELIRERAETLIEHVQETKTSNGRPLIYPTTKWDERFMTLLKGGYYVITKSDLSTIGKLFHGELSEEKAYEFGKNIVETLAEFGLYQKTAKAYKLSRELMAYFLKIDRLPTGELTSLDSVLRIIKDAIEMKRERLRKKRHVTKTTKE